MKQGQLVIVHEGRERRVECAIPWAEVPHLRRALDEGRPFRFSYRVNDDAGVGCMGLSRGRSVAKRGTSFGVNWVEHWTNQVHFVFEKQDPTR